MPIELYGLLSREASAIIEVFANRDDAEAVVTNWSKDEPQAAGALEVVSLYLSCEPN